MKICYVWVEKFRNFENAGFNFSSSEKFEYDPVNDILEKIELLPLPKVFFGERISDVTALIGENGSGKSNALELVCKVLKGGKSSIRNDFFIIIQEEGRFKCYHKNSIFFNPTRNFDLELYLYDKGIDPLKIIFSSNVFDEREYNFDTEISDLSKNKSVKESSRLFLMIKKEISEFKIQMNFINSHYFGKLNIKSPNQIQIISNVWNKTRNISSERQLFGDYTKEFKEFISIFRTRINDIKIVNNKLYYTLVYALFQETLKQINKLNYEDQEKKKNYLNEFKEITGFYKTTSTEEMIYDLMLWMEYIARDMKRIIEKYYSNDKNTYLFEEQLKILKELKELLQELKIENNNEGRGSRFSETFVIEYSNKNTFLIDKLASFIDDNRMFEINWLGISSGHKAYINIFSSIFNELKWIRKTNLLLCIDEGDLYLHPKWQTEFLDRLLTFLPQMFGGEIQIILTSHSPFLLSDLPKQNVNIFNEEYDKKIIDGFTLNKETFAGNLYKLYEEPFFLGNQRLSLFASKKINYIIENIKTKKELNNKELNHYISLIGDDVIKYHLEKRLNND